MSTSDAAIVVLSFFHTITGHVLLRDQRLSDFLNDRRETVIRLNEVAVAPLSNPGRVSEQHDYAVVDKDNAVMVFEQKREDVQVARRLHAFSLRQAHEVFLIARNLEVQGAIHTVGNFDAMEIHRFLATSGDKFVPITEAKVKLPGLDFENQFGVMINVQHIHYIAKTG